MVDSDDEKAEKEQEEGSNILYQVSNLIDVFVLMYYVHVYVR